MHKLKLLTSLIVFALITGGCFAMIETLSCDDLINGSDMIVIASVVDISKADSEKQKELPMGMEILANTVEINEHLTNTSSKKQIIITTIKGFEDEITFEKNETYLLFLKKNDDGYIVFNSPQGAFKIEPDNSLSGMIKLGITLDSAKEKIAKTNK